MQTKIGSRMFGSLALVAVLAVPAGAFAQKVKVSDAQVEANVLKAFAADTRLSNQPINTSTVFGTVTLTGSVTTDSARDAAEQIASRTDGVQKVVDQLTVGAAVAQNSNDLDPSAANTQPSSGVAIPAAQGRAIASSQAQSPENANQPPNYPQQQGQYPQDQGQYSQQAQGQYPPQQGQYQQQGQYPQGQGYPPQQGNPQQGYPQQQGQYPQQQGQYGPPQQGGDPAYGQQQPPYGQPGQYPQNGDPQAQGAYPPSPQNGRLYRRDYERQMANQQQQGYGQGGPQQGQPGGQQVVIPNGTDLAVRINRWISSGDAAPGSTFSAFVSNDVLAGGQIAIPRGATVEGTVIDAKGAGVLKGRGTLTLQLNTLELGGQRIPLQTETFTVNGRDKAAQSVNSTIIGAGVGALLGAAIGRGTGAAIGAGVGGAAGLGTAAASGGGQANLPPEALLHFRLTTPTQVVTVSEAEMQRLGGFAGPARGFRGEGGPGPYARPYPPVAIGVGVGYPYRRYYRGGGYIY